MAKLRRPFGRKVKFQGITFDSQLERNVYCKLDSFFPGEVKVHQSLVLSTPDTIFKPEIEELIKTLKWKIDFYIPSLLTAVEVKGIWEQVDRLRLMMALELLDADLLMLGVAQTLRISKGPNSTNIKNLRVIMANAPPKCWFNRESQTYQDWFIGINQFNKIATKDAFLEALNL